MEIKINKKNEIRVSFLKEDAFETGIITDSYFNAIGGVQFYLSDLKDKNKNKEFYYLVSYKSEIFSSKNIDSIISFVSAFNYKKDKSKNICIQQFLNFESLVISIESHYEVREILKKIKKMDLKNK